MWMKDQIEKEIPSRLLQENAKHLSLHPRMTMEQENDWQNWLYRSANRLQLIYGC